jgi:hypothetical protein
MNGVKWLIFMGITFVLVLEIPTLLSTRIMAQAENTTLFQNKKNDSVIWNMKDHTITLVNGTTNETKTIGNFTTNETKTIGNLTVNPGNSLSNLTTEKFDGLQNK